MKEVLEVLELKVRVIENCLNDKNWSSTGTKHHIEIREKSENDLAKFKKAIEILTSVTP